MDKESNTPLEGVSVAVLKDSTILTGGITDNRGKFKIPNVPVGRVNMQVSYIGYQRILLPNVLVNSGKEPIVTFEMQPSIETKDEVVVQAQKHGESIAEMSVLSSHTFSVEETDRYAGSRGDPARMATNFAGVSGNDDSQNDLVVRGNSPFGVIYRVDNVVIPNPNHFSIVGATGGSVAILDNKLLTNSDFLTGAFPAEYGNGIAGVFDIRLKNGNTDQNEYTAQVGVLGAELFGEGPLSSGSNASYIFNVRYATLQGLQAMGVSLGTTAVPKYEDAQFKFNFPLKNGDDISFYGIGGLSSINFITSSDKDPAAVDIYATPDQNEYFRAGMGVLAMTYTHRDNDLMYDKFSFGVSTEYNGDNFYRVARHINSIGDYVVDSIYHKERYTVYNTRATFDWTGNYKISARSALRYGVTAEVYMPYASDSNLLEPAYNAGLTNFEWQIRLNAHDPVFTVLQPYIQWKYALTDKISTEVGLHGEYMSLNSNSWSIEPRFSINYQFKPNQSIAFGTGTYSQMLPVYQYFVQDSLGHQYNKDMGLVHSFHAVLGYNLFLKQDIHIRIETYYQLLWNIPVDTFSSSYSIMDEGTGFNWFFPGKLVNKGLGRNYGLELTVEKFFTHNWFMMFSGSVYESQLTGSDGQWWSSDYNSNYVFNLLGTKEFKWGKKRVNTIGIGGKITFSGGLRFTPYDTVQSARQEDPVVIDNQRNKYQFAPYFRFDIKLNYRCNTKRFTHEVGIDLVNVTGQQNILRVEYVSPSEPALKLYQLGFLPLFYYRLDFSFGKKS